MTWLTTSSGDLHRDNLKTLAAVVLAIAGGFAVLTVGIYEAMSTRDVHASVILYAAGITVAPLTGGVVASRLKGASDARTANAIQNGTAPGRRATDTAETSTNG